jgi:uncharacterized integral membrane protein
VADQNQPAKAPERPVTARRVVIAVLVVYVVLFVLLNTRRISVNFVFFSLRTQLLTGLVFIAVLSFVAGFLVRGWRMTGRPFGRSRGGEASPSPPAPDEVETKV